MRGMRKSRRVSWASDVNLCQVKLFLSEESPSQVGLNGEEHLQAKASWPSHSTGSDDNLPPGFEGIQPANLLKNKLSQIPVIRWKCPPRFAIDLTWQVVAGEESKELEIENQREMRVLEAVYPRPSAIPPNPALLMGIEDSYHGDQHTPLIPLTPIEDEDAGADTSFDNTRVPNTDSTLLMSTHPQQVSTSATLPPQLNAGADTSFGMNHAGNGIPPSVDPDILNAAYSAIQALSNNDQGNLIDPNLLMNILSNPQMIEKLVSTHGASANPQSGPMPISISDPPPNHVPFSSAASSSGSYYPPPSRVGPTPGPIPNLRPPPPPPPPLPEVVLPVGLPPPVRKDLNYYKSLIQQHGGDKPESKSKVNKPCIYFNSSRGCRHGANCAFQHDSTSQQRTSSLPEVQSAKRMKMDREITGT